MALSICYWRNFVATSASAAKLAARSENKVDSNQVLKLVYDREEGIISAVVQASQKDKSYTVQVCNIDYTNYTNCTRP